MVEVDGEYVDKFTRQTQMKITEGHIEGLRDLKFDGPVRHKVKDDNLATYTIREPRSATDYVSYAKDRCENFKMDRRKYNLCIKQNRYIGVRSEKDFAMLKEDVKFLDDCLKTVLREHEPLFRARYIEGKSIRKYAEELGVNRGSVDYRSRKLLTDLPPRSKPETNRTAFAD